MFSFLIMTYIVLNIKTKLSDIDNYDCRPVKYTLVIDSF